MTKNITSTDDIYEKCSCILNKVILTIPLSGCFETNSDWDAKYEVIDIEFSIPSTGIYLWYDYNLYTINDSHLDRTYDLIMKIEEENLSKSCELEPYLSESEFYLKTNNSNPTTLVFKSFEIDHTYKLELILEIFEQNKKCYDTIFISDDNEADVFFKVYHNMNDVFDISQV